MYLKRTKKTVSFKKRAPKKLTAKSVAKIAKSVVMRQAETKSPINALSLNLFAPNVYAINLNHFIGQGSAAYQVTGEKVFIKNMRLKMYADFQFASYNATNLLRCFVIKTKKALTNTSTVITNSDVFRNDGSANPNLPARISHIDLHKVSLISQDRIIEATPSIVDTVVSRAWEFNIPINRTEYFDQDNSGDFKNGSYYLILAVQKSGDVGLAVNTNFSVQWSINIKDD